MDFQKGNFIATSLIAFSTSFGVMIALLSLVFQMRKPNYLEIFVYVVIYININLLVLLILKRMIEHD